MSALWTLSAIAYGLKVNALAASVLFRSFKFTEKINCNNVILDYFLICTKINKTQKGREAYASLIEICGLGSFPTAVEYYTGAQLYRLAEIKCITPLLLSLV